MWVILPVKRLILGKSRLAAALSPAQRAELTHRMLDDVLAALHRCASVQKILILSNEPTLTASHISRVEQFSEATEGDLNRSLMSLAAELPASAERVLILPCDVPTVCASDIAAFDGSKDAEIVLAPATADGGTNALSSALPLRIALRFGANSLAHHLEAAQRVSAPVRILRRRGLIRDIDRREDLEWLARSGFQGRAATYARRMLMLADDSVLTRL